MKNRNYLVYWAFMVAILALPVSGSAQIGEKIKRTLGGLDPKSDTKEDVSGPKALDKNELRNILPQWDPRKQMSEQFPHIAVTVLKSPTMWAEPAYVDPQQRQQPVPGCFTLQLRIWTDVTNSKVVGPFDWCAPRDLEVTPAMLGSSRIVSAGLTSRSMTETQERYQTGLIRTEGPRPPDTIAPNDPETEKFVIRNNREGKPVELSIDTNTRFGMMFFNLRVGMGQRFDHADRRVWIVEIRDPSRPEPLVASGTLSPPLEQPSVVSGGASSGSSPLVSSPDQLVDSRLGCPQNQKVMDAMRTQHGYQCVNGTLWVPKPAGLEQSGGSAVPNTSAFAIGDVVVPKIASVKLLSEPRDDAHVVRTLTKTDELVVAGADTNGFSNVEGSNGKGWVKTVMVGKR